MDIHLTVSVWYKFVRQANIPSLGLDENFQKQRKEYEKQTNNYTLARSGTRISNRITNRILLPGRLSQFTSRVTKQYREGASSVLRRWGHRSKIRSLDRTSKISSILERPLSESSSCKSLSVRLVARTFSLGNCPLSLSLFLLFHSPFFSILSSKEPLDHRSFLCESRVATLAQKLWRLISLQAAACR